MPKHYAVAENIQAGVLQLNGVKVSRITFPKAFTSHPSVTITLEDSGSSYTPHREKVKKTEFRVVFKTPYSGSIGWTAVETGI